MTTDAPPRPPRARKAATPRGAASARARKARVGGPGGRAELRKPSGMRRWVKRAVAALAVVVALPFLVALLYAAPLTRPVSTLMAGDLLKGRGYVREWRDLEDFPPHLVASVLASEDGKFCAHGGVDWDAVVEVARDAMEGERTRGASTVTMQTVKNLFLPPVRSFVRKAVEVPLASFADLVWGKRRTLEIYLNVAEWAPGHYGAAAGARFWFGKDVSRLSRVEAARLAVTLPNPHLRNPADPGPRVSALARVNEIRARGMGPYLTCLSE